MYSLKLKIWTFLIIIVSSLSLGFDLNGLYVLFGLSVFIGVGVVIYLCKLYVGIFAREYKKLFIFLSFCTIAFANLDTVAHWRNAQGYNPEIAFKIQENDRKSTSYKNELKRLEQSEGRLIMEYGSATLRERARKTLLERKDYLQTVLEELAIEKVGLINKITSDLFLSTMKTILIILLEITFAGLIYIKPRKEKVKLEQIIPSITPIKVEVQGPVIKPSENKEDIVFEPTKGPEEIVKEKTIKVKEKTPISSITKEELELIERLIKDPPNKTVRYFFDKKGKEELFERALQHGLVFIIEGEAYTYSKELANYKK